MVESVIVQTRFESGFGHPTKRKLSPSAKQYQHCTCISIHVLFFNQGRKIPQTQRDGLHLSYAVPEIHWVSSSTAPKATRLSEVITFFCAK